MGLFVILSFAMSLLGQLRPGRVGLMRKYLGVARRRRRVVWILIFFRHSSYIEPRNGSRLHLFRLFLYFFRKGVYKPWGRLRI